MVLGGAGLLLSGYSSYSFYKNGGYQGSVTASSQPKFMIATEMPAAQTCAVEATSVNVGVGTKISLSVEKAAKVNSSYVNNVLTGFDDVSNYISTTGKLPANFIKKAEAKTLGWNPKLGNLDEVAPGKSIGGDVFKNNEGLLPKSDGRIWYEANINYSTGFRGSDRLLYSSDD